MMEKMFCVSRNYLMLIRENVIKF